jgi:glutaredoxin-like protein
VALLKDDDRKQLKEELSKLQNAVKLILFMRELDCEYCGLTKQVLEEIVSLSDLVKLQIYNAEIDKEAVALYKIKRVPAIALARVEPGLVTPDGAGSMRDRDYGIRYYGVPAGYEFASLVGDIMDVSLGESGLSAASLSALKDLKDPVHLQVFTTPT